MKLKIKKEKSEENNIRIKKEKNVAQYQKNKKINIKKENITIKKDKIDINEINQLKNELNSKNQKKNNKKEKNNNNSFKRNKAKSKNIEKENDLATLISVRSLSESKKEDIKSEYYTYKNNENNNSKKNDKIKNENEDNNIIEIKNEESDSNNINISYNYNYNYISPLNKNNNFINNDNENCFTPVKNNIIEISNNDDIDNINNYSFKEIDYDSSLGLENSYSYSFPLECEEKIQLIDDPTYFSKNSRYIKYNPIDYYLPPVPLDKKKPLFSRIGKTPKIVFKRKEKMHIDNDNDITDITSYENDNNELPAILTIPRIRPFREEHIKMIKDKIIEDGIKIYQTENEDMRNEEKSMYLGSFLLYDEKNNIKVYVPVYDDNERMKQFIKKKNLEIIEFQEDNDIDTDDEQLELEIERNNEALLNFMKEVEKDKDYVDKNLHRKKKK